MIGGRKMSRKKMVSQSYKRGIDYYCEIIDKHKLIPNKKLKDTLFALCVKRPDYLLGIYRSLHPEDTEATEEDLRLVNIENLFVMGIYNDCAFLVRKKTLILIECQTWWSENIPFRIDEYHAALYPVVIPDFQDRKYRRKKLDVPDVEYYLFYVGDEIVPERIFASSLSSPVPDKPYVPVNVYTKRNITGFAKEIFDFCEIRDRMGKEHGNGAEAIEETIIECLRRGILVELIREKRHEVEAHMAQISKLKLAGYLKARDEEMFEEGEASGMKKGAMDTYKELLSDSSIPEEMKEILKAKCIKLGMETA